MTDALIGASGFVGSNLSSQRDFPVRYTSSDSRAAIGREFDRVYFSAARAEKWRINQDPESDSRHVSELIELVRGVRAEQFVLISTVDVYPHPAGVDEASTIEAGDHHAYGRHRLRLESAVREAHPSALIVRLPGLFGPGLKKNVIFDLMEDNGVERLNPASSFQYYDLADLSDDIELALRFGTPLVNLTSEPLSTGAIAEECFGTVLPERPEPPARYDVRSRYADLAGGRDGYWRDADTVLSQLRAFVGANR